MKILYVRYIVCKFTLFRIFVLFKFKIRIIQKIQLFLELFNKILHSKQNKHLHINISLKITSFPSVCLSSSTSVILQLKTINC